MNAYNIICEFLDKIMTKDNCLSFLIYKAGTKDSDSAPYEEYRLRLIYQSRMPTARHTNYIDDYILRLDNHFRKEFEENGYDFTFKSDDLLKAKHIMFMIIEHYIWWSCDGESGLSTAYEEEIYLESLEDLSLTQFEEEVDWIEKQIPGLSWKDFQNMRKLQLFTKK